MFSSPDSEESEMRIIGLGWHRPAPCRSMLRSEELAGHHVQLFLLVIFCE
jgi:hypothetical protein